MKFRKMKDAILKFINRKREFDGDKVTWLITMNNGDEYIVNKRFPHDIDALIDSESINLRPLTCIFAGEGEIYLITSNISAIRLYDMSKLC